MNKMITAILGAFLVLSSCFSFAQPPANFQQAKIQAAEIFKEHRQTLYCHCNYNEEHSIDLNSCHLDDLGNRSRAHRLEWEHMLRRFSNMLSNIII
ncbi:MAG: hypothetical protein K2P99_04850 [Burkholderiales bacterium]|nr:hypothetical protein [Burkholderiales bacterium]